MTHYSLFIEARFRPEIVERILRIVRHRGFELCSLNVIRHYGSNNNKNTNINLCLTIVSNRPVCLLFFQLKKIVDVVFIDFR
ncbi:acetolactate synthase 2 small subunit [Blochmannia endosymbiont of Camponotus (Colobopsis) obliquus]|uniref:acetolactate synthase 2 small subunit n=1 Tax=Blochmannia endosymbiont of Camponotus (Colobopsis) obliquus TaxID=1505597 RepID=UPI00061A70CD|nr:acetolactate synthase 2 small subunit [Blochmannia endosymbiont of Camponotus (Colobopsis) obliquus]AKC60732.1 acetolactate synthase isozyme 2 small subunit [Blochmannia endosymbiont of Camponotus (Colobopsis) obliquus]